MTSIEPVILIYGSPATISAIDFSVPVKSKFIFDQVALEQLFQSNVPLDVTSIPRYFLVLLDRIDHQCLELIKTHHRIEAIYSRDIENDQDGSIRKIHQKWQQFILDLANDIMKFLIELSDKERALENVSATQIYYRQSKTLKEWVMSSVKAEATHILLIPLNTNEDNLIDAQQQVQNLTRSMGYPSTIIRVLSDYIPSSYANQHYLLPYSELLFKNESTTTICKFIKNLCPVRFYLYGNETQVKDVWANQMIHSETAMMSNEDDWCAFLENESIDDEVKWNLFFTYGRGWTMKSLKPIKIGELNRNLRFFSAFRRSQRTMMRRQTELTAKIFKWYDEYIRDGCITIIPKVFPRENPKNEPSHQLSLNNSCGFSMKSPLSTDKYKNKTGYKLAFICLDSMPRSSEDTLDKFVSPSKFVFFRDAFECLSHIQRRLNDGYEIFFVSAGHSGYQLFTSTYRFLSKIRYIYIYCSTVDEYGDWTRFYGKIRGLFDDDIDLAVALRKDLDALKETGPIIYENEPMSLTSTTEKEMAMAMFPQWKMKSVPMLIYNRDEVNEFIEFQRTVDVIAPACRTSSCFFEMIDEIRRVFENDPVALVDIAVFQDSYDKNAAIQWYTRDTFLHRFMNEVLRSNDGQLLLKMHPFLSDLYIQLDQQYRSAYELQNLDQKEIVYRGQIISMKDFEKFRTNIGQVITIKTFFSTSTSLLTALFFANAQFNVNDNDQSMPVIIAIEMNLNHPSSRPYANISHLSVHSDEDEVLFAMGSLFRIQSIDLLEPNREIQVITLELTEPTYIDTHQLT